jgi:hypothetical protein
MEPKKVDPCAPANLYVIRQKIEKCYWYLYRKLRLLILAVIVLTVVICVLLVDYLNALFQLLKRLTEPLLILILSGLYFGFNYLESRSK